MNVMNTEYISLPYTLLLLYEIVHKLRQKKDSTAKKMFLTPELCRRQFRKCCLNAEQSLPTTNGRPSTASKDPNLCQALLKID